MHAIEQCAVRPSTLTDHKHIILHFYEHTPGSTYSFFSARLAETNLCGSSLSELSDMTLRHDKHQTSFTPREGSARTSL